MIFVSHQDFYWAREERKEAREEESERERERKRKTLILKSLLSYAVREYDEWVSGNNISLMEVNFIR